MLLAPLPNELAAAFEAAQGGGHLQEKLHVGSLLADLEAMVNNAFIRGKDGTIIGRISGLRGLLREYMPSLELRYSTLMRWKSLADKLQWCCGLWAPGLLDAVLPQYAPNILAVPAPYASTLDSADEPPYREVAPALAAERLLGYDFLQQYFWKLRLRLGWELAQGLLGSLSAGSLENFAQLFCARLGIEKKLCPSSRRAVLNAKQTDQLWIELIDTLA